MPRRKQPFPPEADTVPGVPRSAVTRPQSGAAPKGELERSEAPTLPPPPSTGPEAAPGQSTSLPEPSTRPEAERNESTLPSPRDPRAGREPRRPTPRSRAAARTRRANDSTVPPPRNPRTPHEPRVPAPSPVPRDLANDPAESNTSKKMPGSDVREVTARRRAPAAATVDEVTADLSKDPRRERNGDEDSEDSE